MLYDKDYYIEDYLRRNEEIKKYFADRGDDLLLIDIKKEKSTEKVCGFLNIPRQFITPVPMKTKLKVRCFKTGRLFTEELLISRPNSESHFREARDCSFKSCISDRMLRPKTNLALTIQVGTEGYVYYFPKNSARGVILF